MPVNVATKKAAAEALAAIEQYDREGFECGINRVHLHYSDVEGSWLDELAEGESAVPPVGKIQVRIPFPWQGQHSSSYVSLVNRSAPSSEVLQGIVSLLQSRLSHPQFKVIPVTCLAPFDLKR
jgi:hypothetical protein